MRAFLSLGLALSFALACGGLSGTSLDEPEEDALAEAAAPPSWTVFADEGGDFVKAGTAQGLVVDAPLTLLGPPIGDTDHREIVGSAKVVKVWEDLAKIEKDHWQEGTSGEPVARTRLPEDAAAIDALPAVEAPAQTPAHRTAAAATAATPTAEQPLVLPADLQGGSADQRMDALSRYEDDSSATDVIIYVMKHDLDPEVRRKAWRVVRARWRRGTGSRSAHEAAAVWASDHAAMDVRVEAIAAIGKRSSSLSRATRHLGDGSAELRRASAKALVDMAVRLGKQDTARAKLNAAIDKEADAKTRKYFLKVMTDL